ncbi:MAG: synthase subunit [Bacteroidota bacterium]
MKYQKNYLCGGFLSPLVLFLIKSLKTPSLSALYGAFLLVFLCCSPLKAQHEGHHDAQTNVPVHQAHGDTHESHAEKFNAGKMILEHVTDAHDWHLWGHSSIPLPVIIYSPGLGLDVFMSSKFEHGHAIAQAKQNYRLNGQKIEVVNEQGETDSEKTAAIYDLSITKNVASLLVTISLLLWIFLSIASAYKRSPGTAPKGIQSFLEPIVIMIRDDVAKASIGEKKYMKFMPYLLTVFFFIWLNNMMGLVPIAPGGANLTGNVAVTLTLAVFTFFITCLNGNAHYWRHIFAMPGVPAWVLVLLTPIEILGVFLKPFVLMVRLFANITAGHIIALAFFSLIFIFGEMHVGAGLGFSLLSTLFTVFMMMMELLVAFLQAYVFTLLSAVYFGAAVEEAHHDDHH